MNFLLLLLLTYLCGLVGSMLASARQIRELPPNTGIFLLILLFQVITFWPLQIAKVAVALTVSCLLQDNPWLACGICFACGFALITLIPLLMRIWRALAPSLARAWSATRRLIGKIKNKFKS